MEDTGTVDGQHPASTFSHETFDIKSSKARKMTSRKETPPGKPKKLQNWFQNHEILLAHS